LIIRSSAFFGPWDRANFAYKTIESVANGLMFGAADDVLISPTYVPDLVHAALDLFIDEGTGIWHIANEGNLSWAEFGGVIAERAGYSKKFITLLTSTDMGWIAKRPAFSVIKSKRGVQLPRLEQAIHRYFNERVV
jgi:dTDP-4-dehydrorhamnose reductase